MLFITDKEFERAVSRTRNRHIARQYHRNDAVYELSIDIKSNQYEITGSVVAEGYMYSPELTVNMNSKVITARCNCLFSDELTTCPHCGALILKVQDLAPETFPFHYVRQEGESKAAVERRAIQERALVEEEPEDEGYMSPAVAGPEVPFTDNTNDVFKRMQRDWDNARKRARNQVTATLTRQAKAKAQAAFDAQSQKSEGKVNLTVCGYSNARDTGLRFRIGRDKMYYLKDLPAFLDDMRDNRVKSYGKNLTWKHDEDSLTEEARKIYHLMRDHAGRSLSYLSAGKNILPLTDDNIDDAVFLLRDLPESSTEGIHLETLPLIPQISRHEDHDEVRYDLGGTGFNMFGAKDAYLVTTKNDVIRISCACGDEAGVMVSLLKAFDDNDYKLYVPLDKDEEFRRYVLTPIDDHIVLDLPDTNVPLSEDSLELYGDVNDYDEAVFNLIGVYDGREEDLLQNKNQPRSATAELVHDHLYQNATYTDDAFYFNLNDEDKVAFLMGDLNFLRRYVNVYVTDALRLVESHPSTPVDINVTVSHGLLELDIESEGIPKEELAAVLQSVRKHKKFHRLKNGEMIYVDNNGLSELFSLLDLNGMSAKDLQNGHLTMAAARAYAMNESIEESKYLNFSRSDAFSDIIERIQSAPAKEHLLNDHYNAILRDYQKEGYQWLWKMNDLGLGGILADDMGLGKTVQMMAMLENADEHFSLIVCPASLVLNWADEFAKFASHLNTVCVSGPAASRKSIIRDADNYDVLITSYDYLRRDAELYKDLVFDYIVIDEAQYIKNPQTKNARSVKSVRGRHRFALTGTPIENTLTELWSIVDFINPGYLYSQRRFAQMFDNTIVTDEDQSQARRLKRLVSPLILRRTKKQVLTELPDKVENTIAIEFTSKERKLYVAQLAAAKGMLKDYGVNDRFEMLVALTRLRQICVEPRLAYDNIDTMSSKMEGCLDIIGTYHDNHKKIIVFSSFKSLLELLSQELGKRRIKYHMLTGDTPAMQRRDNVEAFQTDDSTVFLISLKAGGTGLNLTAAEGVIHFDPWWNLAAQNQATDRAHRIGQVNTLFVYKLIIKNSIEEKILKIQEEKKRLSDTFVEDNEGIITSMTTSELLSLFDD